VITAIRSAVKALRVADATVRTAIAFDRFNFPADAVEDFAVMAGEGTGLGLGVHRSFSL
jgi:hypothetical protein